MVKLWWLSLRHQHQPQTSKSLEKIFLMVIDVFSFNRFDSTNRYINDPDVRLEFYASDEVKEDKKIVSRPTCS